MTELPPPVAVGSARPTLDRPTWIAYVQLSVYACFLYGFGATQALLRDEQETTRSVASLHGTSLAVGGFIGALLAARAIHRWGRGIVLRFTAIGTAASILVYTDPSARLGLTLAGAALISAFGTMLLISINAFLLDYQGGAGPAALTQANALASFAGLLGPLLIGLGAATFLGWRAGLWLVVAMLIALELWRGRDVSVFGTRGLAEHEADGRRLPRRIGWSLAVVMCFIGAEFCMTFWGADLLRVRCDFGPAAAAAALGSITGGMLVGRLVGARLAERRSSESILRGSIWLALAAFVLVWTPTLWPVVVFGMFLTGIGLGVQWPLGVARVVRASGGMTDRASASASLYGSIAIAGAPFALGVLSDTIGFHVAFLLVPLFLLLAMGLLVVRPLPDEHIADG